VSVPAGAGAAAVAAGPATVTAIRGVPGAAAAVAVATTPATAAPAFTVPAGAAAVAVPTAPATVAPAAAAPAVAAAVAAGVTPDTEVPLTGVTIMPATVAVPVGDCPAFGVIDPAVTDVFSATTTKLESSKLYVKPLVLPAEAVLAGLEIPQYACPVTVAVSVGRLLVVPVASCWLLAATTDHVPPVDECRLSASSSQNVLATDAE
jgi:hypothetical protein